MVAREADTRSVARDDGHLPDEVAALAEHALRVLGKLKRGGLTLATAESCTGGLLASLLTDQDGFGRCFDRGFVTYTDAAKSEMLGIDRAAISRHGAVSAEIAAGMAQGVLAQSEADLAIAITGYAGPAGLGDEVGLVHLACRRRGGRAILRACRFGELGRERIRNLSVQRALEMAEEALEETAP
jgi:nicotinamide-nucleotide amidase